MLQPVGIRIATTMADSTKGSMRNRTQCAKEHIKNDVSAGLKITGLTASVAAPAIFAPNLLSKVATTTGNVISKGFAGVAKLLGKTKLKGNAFTEGVKIASEMVSKNAKKTGIYGLAFLGVSIVLNTLLNHAKKEGQIDQKYTDAAKIEAQTKNIILEERKGLTPIIDARTGKEISKEEYERMSHIYLK